MTRLALTAVVYGVPAPQGSKQARAIYRGSAARGTREFTGKVAVTEMSKKVAPWRQEVAKAIAAAIRATDHRSAPWTPLDAPLEVRVTFTLARPKSVSAARRPWPTVTPDKDKLERSTLDGITMGGAWRDDCLVVRSVTEKIYTGSPGALDRPGAVIEIWTLGDVTPAALATTSPRPASAA
jgi:Holliday junction resolvase RusA-like endonuclease